MPKLDPFQISSRLHDKLEDLRAGKEVAVRDLKALLSNERLAEIEQSWLEQKALRKKKRARTKEEEALLGWKSKRQIQIEAVEAELFMHDANVEADLEQEMRAAELRSARIYLDAVFKALDEGYTIEGAQIIANNKLTRAGLQRTDRHVRRGLTTRDREILELEQSIMQRLESEMDEFDREQLELLRDTERTERTRRTKR
jgi:hypothetical protein